MRGRKKMKKFVGIIVATVLAFSLVGCGPVDSAIQNIASSGSNTSSKSGVVTADDDGYAEGRMGDVMRTYFFDYTVNSAYTCNDYEGYTPSEGNKLLVAEITVKNTDLPLPCMTPISRSSGAMMITMTHTLHLSPTMVTL